MCQIINGKRGNRIPSPYSTISAKLAINIRFTMK